jgi:hypothetical protein
MWLGGSLVVVDKQTSSHRQLALYMAWRKSCIWPTSAMPPVSPTSVMTSTLRPHTHECADACVACHTLYYISLVHESRL